MQGGRVYKAAYSKIPNENEESQIDLISCWVNILYQTDFVSDNSMKLKKKLLVNKEGRG